MDNLSEINSELYFSKIKNLVKFDLEEDDNDLIEKHTRINNYLTTLPLDLRKEAIGMELVAWYSRVVSIRDSVWTNNYSINFAGSVYEMPFLMANPSTSLMSVPAWNTKFAKMMNDNSTLTMVNNYQLDLFENFAKQDFTGWNYSTVSMQDIEAGDGGSYDFICISAFDVLHKPELIKSFFNMLNPNGTLMILHVNNNGKLYKERADFSSFFEIHEELKSIENSRLYHNPTAAGTTFAIKL